MAANLPDATWRRKSGLVTWSFDVPLRAEEAPQPALARASSAVLAALGRFALARWLRVTTRSRGDDALVYESLVGVDAELLATAFEQHDDLEQIWFGLDLRVTPDAYAEVMLEGAAALWCALEWPDPDRRGGGRPSLYLTLSLDVDLYAPVSRGQVRNNAELAALNGPRLREFLRRIRDQLGATLADIDTEDYRGQVTADGFASAAGDVRSTFPIGAALEGAHWVVTAHLRGTPIRGMYRATEGAGGASGLVTIGTRQTAAPEGLLRRLGFQLPGVAPLRFIGRVQGQTGFDAMVEEEPGGRTTSDLTLGPHDSARLGLRVADVMATAHAAGVVLSFVRPELIFADGQPGQLELTGIAPRAEAFLSTAAPSSIGAPPLFDQLYEAPEVLALKGATPASDVFSLCGVLAFWSTGVAPFDGDTPIEQMNAIMTGKRRPWRGPDALAGLVERGLAVDPARRPDLDQVRADLRAVTAR